jgi:branched-chain amino acid aminotransferase
MLQQFNEKNKDLIIYVGGELLHRDEAKVSVFDSLVQGGDGIWEGLRVYDGKIFCMDKHLDRMHFSAKALDFKNIPSKDEIRNAVFETLKANGMRDGVHIRLTLSRGEKITSGMDPRLNTKGCCLIVVAEYKAPVYDGIAGLKLVTSSQRRNNPMFLDSKIHHNNLLNNIIAKIEANFAKCDDALMLDMDGFVAETNATNIFMTKGGKLLTSIATACLNGITRGLVMDIAQDLDIDIEERQISLSEFYGADTVFTTATMGELTPVEEIDGRAIENLNKCDILDKINVSYKKLTQTTGTIIPD